MHYFYYTGILLLFFLSACEYETDNPIPGYISIDNISLNHENAIGITDAWVYVGAGDIQGVYELPAKFPVIAEGNTTIRIQPGIKVNGLSGTRSYYPFYEPYEVNVGFKAGETIKLSPVSEYVDWATLIKVDDFESGRTFFSPSNNSDTTIQISTDGFEGEYCGKVSLDTKRPFFEAYTTEQFSVPDFDDYSGMFLEMNFKGTDAIEVGLIVNGATTVDVMDVIYLNSTDKWKKIYIDLYNPLIGYSEGTQFKVYIAAKLNTNSGRESEELFVDDIKMIHK